MKITRIDPTQAKPDPSTADYFDGEVKFQRLVSSADSDELDLLSPSPEECGTGMGLPAPRR